MVFVYVFVFIARAGIVQPLAERIFWRIFIFYLFALFAAEF